jgi:uncharacterized protein DUF2442
MILHVIRAEYLAGHRVHVWFSDNSDGDVDFQPLLDGPIFEPLKNVDFFQRFRLEGHTLVWDNGADFAPEYLHGLIRSTAMSE